MKDIEETRELIRGDLRRHGLICDKTVKRVITWDQFSQLCRGRSYAECGMCGFLLGGTVCSADNCPPWRLFEEVGSE